MRFVETIEDLFGYPLGDISEDINTGKFEVYHYATDSYFGPFKTKEEAEVHLNRVEYDLK